MTLSEARAELSSIISELNSIETGIRNEFEGIGEDLCGDCINSIANKYRGVLNRLYRVDYNRLASWVNKEE